MARETPRSDAFAFAVDPRAECVGDVLDALADLLVDLALESVEPGSRPARALGRDDAPASGGGVGQRQADGAIALPVVAASKYRLGVVPGGLGVPVTAGRAETLEHVGVGTLPTEAKRFGASAGRQGETTDRNDDPGSGGRASTTGHGRGEHTPRVAGA